MAWRPFRLVGQAQLAAIQAAFLGPLRAWAQSWGIDPACVHCAATALLDNAPMQGDGATLGGGSTMVLLAWPTRWLPRLQSMILAPDHGVGSAPGVCSMLAPQMARVAQQQLLAVFSTAAGAPDDNWQPGAAGLPLGPGEGAVQLHITIDTTSLTCTLAGELAARWLPPGAPADSLAPVDVLQLVHAAPVTLDVVVGEAQLTLGLLLDTGIGDVIKLGRGVDAPLSVELGGRPLFGAFLGRVAGTPVIEVAMTRSVNGVDG